MKLYRITVEAVYEMEAETEQEAIDIALRDMSYEDCTVVELCEYAEED